MSRSAFKAAEQRSATARALLTQLGEVGKGLSSEPGRRQGPGECLRSDALARILRAIWIFPSLLHACLYKSSASSRLELWDEVLQEGLPGAAKPLEEALAATCREALGIWKLAMVKVAKSQLTSGFVWSTGAFWCLTCASSDKGRT